MLVLLVAPWLGMPLPLTPGQILWVNMVTHGLPGVAFSGEPPDPADMDRPSPSPERSVLGGLATQIGVSGVLIAAVAVLAGSTGSGTRGEQTAVFLCLGLAQLWLALALRAPRAGTGWRDRGLEGSVLAAGFLLVLAVLWEPLRRLLDTEAITLERGLAIAALAAVPALLVAVGGWLRRRTTHPPVTNASGEVRSAAPSMEA